MSNQVPSIEKLKEFITFRTSRSGGKGGQHVNKTESRVELIFNFGECDLFSEEESARIRKKIEGKLNQEDELIISSEKFRSQIKNREDAIEKLIALLTNALKTEKKRVRTKPSASSVIKRKESKRKTAEKKSLRRKPDY